MPKKKNLLDFCLDYVYDVMQKLLKYQDDQQSFDKIHSALIKGAKIDGATIIILYCAALIASVGLHQNSIPIIIGAMLISPLMGPILAFGYGIAIYDRVVIQIAVKNLAKSVLITLISSTIFFLVANLDSPTSEILARTSPSIFDIIIAFVGGIAGIIAVTRTEKGNVVVGVAIATALMPPLCTIGYGIANFDIDIIIGAGYLFFINIFFIILATFIIIKAMGMCYSDSKSYIVIKRRRRLISLLVFLVCLPALYSTYTIFVNNNLDNTIEQVGSQISESGQNYLYYEVDKKNHIVKIYYYGSTINEQDNQKYVNEINESMRLNFQIKFIKMSDQDVLDYLVNS